jgi:hypothetical protein
MPHQCAASHTNAETRRPESLFAIRAALPCAAYLPGQHPSGHRGQLSQQARSALFVVAAIAATPRTITSEAIVMTRFMIQSPFL